MNSKEQLGFYAGKTEEALAASLEAFRDERYQAVTDAMRYSLLDGGKRIRGALALAFCELCGGSYQQALPYAAAAEMVHCYSLIHDDLPCMDNDDLRRGKPSCHIRFGEDIALLAGDALLTLAFETAASGSPENPFGALEVVRLLARLAGVDGMIGGQCIDLVNEGKPVDADTVLAMDMKKTVALISAACELGCIAAGASAEQKKAAANYAAGVGMAFQIRDDILDVISDTETLGKETGADSKNEKRNYVSFYGLEHAQSLVDDYTAKAKGTLRLFEGDVSFLNALADDLARREK